jgi:dCTP deaminase
VTLLHKEALEEAMKATLDERLIVSPLLDASQIGEASIDLRLGTDFLLLRRTLRGGVDLADPNLQAQLDDLYEAISIPLGEGLWLHPQQFVLGATLEFIRLPPTMGAYLLGRSSWGRLGLLVATAVMVQPGFSGALTLELVNEGDSAIKLYPGLKIAQLAVHLLPSETLHPYANKYQSPTGPQATQLGKESDELARIIKLGESLRTP